jgi:hypothetical protein
MYFAFHSLLCHLPPHIFSSSCVRDFEVVLLITTVCTSHLGFSTSHPLLDTSHSLRDNIPPTARLYPIHYESAVTQRVLNDYKEPGFLSVL